MSKTCITLRLHLTLLFLAALFGLQAAVPTQAIVNLAKNEVREAQAQLPAYAADGLMLTKVWYIPDTYTIAYKYVYDYFAEKPSQTSLSERKQAAVHMIKANPESKEMSFLTSGITFHYNYYQPDGTFLFALKITPQDIK